MSEALFWMVFVLLTLAVVNTALLLLVSSFLFRLGEYVNLEEEEEEEEEEVNDDSGLMDIARVGTYDPRYGP